MRLTQGPREISPVPAELSTTADVTSVEADPKSSLLRRILRSVSVRALTAFLAATGIVKSRPAKAQSLQDIQSSSTVTGVNFGPDVNNLGIGAFPQLMPGDAANRLEMRFAAPDSTAQNTLYAMYTKSFQVDDDGNGSVVIRGLAPAQRMNIPNFRSSTETASSVKVDRGDGRYVEILDDDTGKTIDGRFQSRDPNYDYSGVMLPVVHPGRVPGTIRFTVEANIPSLPTRHDKNVVDVPITGTDGDVRKWVAERIKAGSPYATGLFNPAVSSAKDEWLAPVVGNLQAISRDDRRTGETTVFMQGLINDAVVNLENTTPGVWERDTGMPPNPDPIDTVRSLAEVEFPLQAGGTRKVKVGIISGNGGRLVVFDTSMMGGATGTQMIQVPVVYEDPVTPPEPFRGDRDGDGVLDDVDNCPNRANPDQVDAYNRGDGIGDACRADCGDQYPGMPATDANTSGLRRCSSEVGYARAYVFDDGSTIHSNMDVVYDRATNAITAQPGQTFYYIHSTGEGLQSAPAPIIRVADGNSLSLQILETKKLDGTPGSITLTGKDATGAQLPPVVFTGPTASMQDYGQRFDIELGLGGCAFIGMVGTQNLTRPNPTVADGGTPVAPDGGPKPDPDAGATGGDAGKPDEPDGGAEGVDANGGSADANDPVKPDGSVDEPDGGPKPNPDAGTIFADASNGDAENADVGTTTPPKTPNCGGCGETGSGAEAAIGVLGFAAAVRRRFTKFLRRDSREKAEV